VSNLRCVAWIHSWGVRQIRSLRLTNILLILLFAATSLSGGDDDAHGNQTTLEAALNGIDADWEITRYSGVVHGFTKWDSEDAYSVMADTRSWDSMLSIFEELMDGPTPVSGGQEAQDDSSSTAPSPNKMGAFIFVLLACNFVLW